MVHTNGVYLPSVRVARYGSIWKCKEDIDWWIWVMGFLAGVSRDTSDGEMEALRYTLKLVMLEGRIRNVNRISLLAYKRFLEKLRQLQRGECRIFEMTRSYSFSRVDFNFSQVNIPLENIIKKIPILFP